MADVPISDALIDSAQFQVQTIAPTTPAGGLVRLFRFTDGWVEKLESGSVRSIEGPTKLAVVMVSTADLLGLVGTPRQLVAGVSGKVLVPLHYAVVFTPGTTAFVGVPALRIGPEALWPGDYYADVSVDMQATVPQITAQEAGGVTQSPLSGHTGSPLMLFNAAPPGDALTVGNGSLVLALLYMTV